jgi:hypothetical protein
MRQTRSEERGFQQDARTPEHFHSFISGGYIKAKRQAIGQRDEAEGAGDGIALQGCGHSMDSERVRLWLVLCNLPASTGN